LIVCGIFGVRGAAHWQWDNELVASLMRARAVGRDRQFSQRPKTGSKMKGSPPAVPFDARPQLSHGVSLVYEEASRRWVLLSPKRAFKADTIAAEIVKRCTGEATLDAIVDDLAKAYSATRGRILVDVMTFLRELSDKNLLEL
jgi:pyrroloquinoline quinone biosynthesis protein D